MRYLKKIIIVLFFFNSTDGWCEGSKQVEPGLSDTTKLTIGTESTQNFANFSSTDSTQKIYIHISDFSTEKIQLGFGRAFGSSAFDGPRSYDRNFVRAVYFRISRPDRSLLVAPRLIPTTGVGYIPNKQTLLNGVNGLDGVMNGYQSLDYSPDMNGDYSIEFSFTATLNNMGTSSFRFELFDFTVSDARTSKSIAGRSWAYKWQFNNILNRNPARGKFYTYTRDSVVTSFELNGIQTHG